MLFSLSAAVSIKTRYIQKRGNVFHFVMRVPSDLVERFGRDRIRESLKTTDPREAARKADALASKYLLQFKTLRGNAELTPIEVSQAAAQLIEQYGDFDDFIDFHIEPRRQKYARPQEDNEDAYRNAPPSEYLSPVEIEALKRFQEGKNAVRLSNALELYWKTHKKSGDAAFAAKVNRDWNKLTSLLGDVTVMSLTRSQARHFVDHCLSEGLKTTSVRRSINHINAVLNVAIREAELTKQNPFSNLPIPGEGQDSEETKVPSSAEIKEIVQTFREDIDSVTSLMILMQAELGTRIGEVSGLGIDDVFLDHEIPHVYFRNRPWRTLKTDESERKVPVVGAALEALKIAVKLPRKGPGLFDQYAKPRGNDNASQAVNKRLKKWGITSHSFRHAMKDRLREAGCPKDIRDAIQGHASEDIADTYGQGFTLKTMQKWLLKVAVEIKNGTEPELKAA